MKKWGAGPRQIRYFNNEIYILKQMNHRNIIKLHDIKQTLNN